MSSVGNDIIDKDSFLTPREPVQNLRKTCSSGFNTGALES